ncbi:MAG: DUF1993 family protein [cyanobacterium endosymbiont of Rhopalodia musculus]|nr:DUF1993 family protein [cyanobacterium endosymbiont of Epithemia clementina EcSB]WGT66885.1 DUF1993 family protein [cyanobacterium endosymbiont of Epithemia clementina EcSB]
MHWSIFCRKTLTFDGQQFALHLIIPNIYFRVTTAYYTFRYCGA